VADPPGSDTLAARRRLVAVLRLVVEPDARILYGDVVDPDTGQESRFVGSSGLTAAVDRWVVQKLHGPEGADPWPPPRRSESGSEGRA
jgi:hypothetical protein